MDLLHIAALLLSGIGVYQSRKLFKTQDISDVVVLSLLLISVVLIVVYIT